FPAFTPLIKFVIGNLVEILGEELKEVVTKSPNTFYYSRKITLEDWIQRLGVEAEPADFFSDGVHPSRLTYQVWAKDLANYMLENPEIRSLLYSGDLDQ
ncbi:MAG: SGNH/GDSL hydrolase family protein, partial [Bacteroidota bacterium]